MDLFNIYLPTDKAVPIVANIPHSGLYIPHEIAIQFSQDYLPNQDWHLDKLYDFLPQLGIIVMQANYSRYVVDLNREIKKPLAGNFWSSVVPLKTAFSQSIYTKNPSLQDIEDRISQYYIPYHQKLESILKQKLQEFEKVYLLDLHSFGGIINDEVCLGNLNGKSCTDLLISIVDKGFSNSGYQAVKNKVFTGGYITRNYSQISGVEALQIELRYHVYLNNNEIEQPQIPNWDVAQFHQTKTNLRDIAIYVCNRLTKEQLVPPS